MADWQLRTNICIDKSIFYYLGDPFTGRTKKIPKNLFPKITKLLEQQHNYTKKALETENKLLKLLKIK